MLMPPPAKKPRQPLKSGQHDVGASAGAAPTGAAATDGVTTPLREEPWPTAEKEDATPPGQSLI